MTGGHLRLQVTPVIARIPTGVPLVPNPGEVDVIFDMVRPLLDAASQARIQG